MRYTIARARVRYDRFFWISAQRRLCCTLVRSLAGTLCNVAAAAARLLHVACVYCVSINVTNRPSILITISYLSTTVPPEPPTETAGPRSLSTPPQRVKQRRTLNYSSEFVVSFSAGDSHLSLLLLAYKGYFLRRRACCSPWGKGWSFR